VVRRGVVPFEPVVVVPHVKRVLSGVGDMLTAPNVEAVTLTLLLLWAAVAPNPEQALIALAMDPAF